MSDTTAISWCDVTWNPITGCTKVSPGCKHCYMFREMRRYGRDPEHVSRTVTTFDAPTKRTRDGAWKWPDGTDVFTASWSDWFHVAADPWRPEMWALVRARPGLRFFVLTKRSERIRDHLPPDWGDGYPNVLLGVSVETAAYVYRVADLLDVPAVGRFVSCEPLLGSLRAPGSGALLRRLDWIIAGGESDEGGLDEGNARPSHPQWFRELRDLAADAGIPFHFKQWGAWGPLVDHPGAGGPSVHGDTLADDVVRVGKHAAGRLLDGREHNDRPRVGRVTRA